MLSVRGLSVRYRGAISALKDVSIDLDEHHVLAVLGSNGAGKTSLLRAIAGTLRLHHGSIAAGQIMLEGERVDRLSAAAIVRRGLVAVPEGRQVFARMTVEENLKAGGITVRSTERIGAARRRVHELFPILSDRAHQRAGLLSGGEQQMLAIGRALMSQPRLLLLDEPTLGLAPQMMDTIAGVVRQIHDQGTSVLIVEQNAAMALDLADTAVALDVGRVAVVGDAAELAASNEVQRLYLGGHARSAAGSLISQPRRSLSRWSA